MAGVVVFAAMTHPVTPPAREDTGRAAGPTRGPPLLAATPAAVFAAGPITFTAAPGTADTKADTWALTLPAGKPLEPDPGPDSNSPTWPGEGLRGGTLAGGRGVSSRVEAVVAGSAGWLCSGLQLLEVVVLSLSSLQLWFAALCGAPEPARAAP
jgi:hypothetical protein